MTPVGHRRIRALLPAALVLLAALIMHGWIAIWDHHVVTFTDSMDYLFMADFYRHTFYGGDAEFAVAHYRNTRFPPIFPLVLGAFGAGTEHQHLASILSNAIAVLALLSLYLWMRAERVSPWFAALLAFASLLFPYWFIVNLTPVSEALGIAICGTVFALLAQPAPGRTRLLVAALMVGIAPLVRGALVPLALGFVLWLAVRNRRAWRAVLWPSVLALAPFALWSVYRYLLGADSYGAYLSVERFSDASMQWPQVLWQQPWRLFQAFRSGWGGADGVAVDVAAGLILGLAAVGCWIRLRCNHLDAWFVAGYLGLILLWPFPAEMTRFVVAVFPFLLRCAATTATAVEKRAGWQFPYVNVAMALIFLTATLPAIARFSHRAALPVARELLGEKREARFFLAQNDDTALFTAEALARGRLVLEQAHSLLPEGSCLYASPYQVGVLHARHNIVAYPPGLAANADQTRAALGRCDYFFLGWWSAIDQGLPPLYPMPGLKGWTRAMLVSEITRDGHNYLAAALLQRIPEHQIGPERPSPADPTSDNPR